MRASSPLSQEAKDRKTFLILMSMIWIPILSFIFVMGVLTTIQVMMLFVEGIGN